MSQRHQLDGLTLLQDATGGTEAIKMFVNQFCSNIADLPIGETLDRIHQHTLIHEERISCHLLKLLVGEVGLTVWNKMSYVVLPCHSELDEMQQVLAAVTNRAGLVAVAVAGDTPLATSAMTGGAALVPGATVTVAEGATLPSSTVTLNTASSSTAVALVTQLDEGRVRHADLLHHVGVSGRHRHWDVPRWRTHTVLRTIHRLTVV